MSSPATHALNIALSAPATAALDEFLKLESSPCFEEHKPMICYKVLKRSRSSSDETSFDMDSLIKASQPVEDSIAFPTIEWCNDLDDEDEEPISEPSSKRRCRGLVRSRNVSSDLSSLGSAPRFSSFGSLYWIISRKTWEPLQYDIWRYPFCLPLLYNLFSIHRFWCKYTRE